MGMEILKDKKLWIGIGVGILVGGTIGYGVTSWIHIKQQSLTGKLKGKGTAPSAPAPASITPAATPAVTVNVGEVAKPA